MPGYIHLIKLT
ncbi:uncharacterized protein FFB14_09438 [Fusarium fujikuroi]|nr:uncharacterized protein FFB14_09438 [Fusarium fujikuroi]